MSHPVAQRPSLVTSFVARLCAEGAEPWQVLAEELSAEAGGPCVVLVREPSGAGKPVAAATADPEDLALLQMVLRAGVIPCAEMDHIANVPRGLSEEELPTLLRQWVAHTPSLVSHVLPIVVGPEVLGLAWLGSTRVNAAGPDLMALQGLAAVAALRQKSLDQGLVSDALAMRAESMMSVHAEELETANEVLDRLGQFVGHEVRDALRCVLGWNRLAGAPEVAADVRLAMLRKVTRATEEALAVVGGVLQDVDQEQARRSELVSVDLNGVGGWVREVVADRLRRQHASLVLEPLHTVLGAPTLLRRCLLELVRNALEFGGQFVEVVVTTRQVGSDVEIRVRDNGPGLDQHISTHVFEAGFGTGIGIGYGLTNVRAALQDIGGRIWLEEEPGEGVTAVIVLPQQDTSGRVAFA